jgi:nucleoside-diphosphate-sugar epimerase
VIAILGATGYIGRSLARCYAETDPRPLVLFARSPERLRGDAWPDHVTLLPLDCFAAGGFDLIVNAIGAGDPRRVAALGAQVLDLTGQWDRAVLDGLGERNRYVFLSSGAIYGAGGAAGGDGVPELAINALDRVPPYTAAKLIAELTHRNLPERSILDLRVFAYADAGIPLNGRFFLAELALSLVRREVFVTAPEDMIRDYAGAVELKALIDCWEGVGAPNGAADLYTRDPVAKHKLLAAARDRYRLETRYSSNVSASPTGIKPVYASNWRRAAEWGYWPRRDALAVVLDALDRLVAQPPPARVAARALS